MFKSKYRIPSIKIPTLIYFRIIASGVRRLSRSFYGGSGESINHTQRRTGSFAELSGGYGNHGSLRQLPTTAHHSQVKDIDLNLLSQ